MSFLSNTKLQSFLCTRDISDFDGALNHQLLSL